jgi:addiction module toxin, RelE/StbE family
MNYRVEFSKDAEKSLKKMDKQQQIILMAWIKKNLVDCTNPRYLGKPLTGNRKGYWRYRVGMYRIISNIEDEMLRINIIKFGH